MNVKDWLIPSIKSRVVETEVDRFMDTSRLIVSDKDIITEWIMGNLYQYHGLKKLLPESVTPYCLVGLLTEESVRVIGYHLTLFTNNDLFEKEFGDNQGYYKFYVSRASKDKLTITTKPLRNIPLKYRFNKQEPLFMFDLYYDKGEFDFVMDQVVDVKGKDKKIDSISSDINDV